MQALENFFHEIYPVLFKTSGIDFSPYKHPTVRRAIQKRMHALRANDWKGYLKRLKKDEEEQKKLAQLMLIKVTHFFRDPEVFKILRSKVFPQLIQINPQAPLRIWVPGCCTGEEAYSLAIALTDYLKSKKSAVPIHVFGTDLSEEALAKARAGLYVRKDLGGVPKHFLQTYFTKADGQYQVDKNIRAVCTFARQNLVQDPPFSKMQLISCRNLLIYLQSEIQERVLGIFHYALKEGGFLLLGKSENMGAVQSALFDTVDKNHSLYVKKNSDSKLMFHFNAAPLKNVRIDPLSMPPPKMEFDLGKEMDRILIERSDRAAALVNHSYDLIQARGDVTPYLRVPSGKSTFNVIKMAKDDLAIELKMLLEKVKKRGEIARRHIESYVGKFDIEVTPFHKPLTKEKYFLILFGMQKDLAPVSLRQKNKRSESKRMAYLKQELAVAKAYLQSMMEDHEDTVHDLKSANEEILSTNEELQSLNEELQTATEELESTNEELTTVNEQLHNQMEALRQSEEKFRVLVESVKEYAIFLMDKNGKVVTWNIGGERIKGYKAEEIIGQHFSKFYSPEDADKPARELAAAGRRGVYKEEGWRVRKDGTRFWASVVITALKDKSGKLHGFAKVTRDMTERKRLEDNLQASELRFRSVAQSAYDAIISADSAGIIISWNAGAERIFGYEEREVAGKPLTVLMPERYREAHRKGIERVGHGGESHVLGRTIELSGLRKNGTEFPLELSLSSWKIQDQVFYTGILRDITDKKKAEEVLRKSHDELEERVQERTKELQLNSEELMRSNADLQQFAYVASHDLQEPLRMVSAYVDLLAEECKQTLSKDGQEYLNFIQDGAVRSQKLIKELLEYSRIGSKGQDFQKVPLEDVLCHVLSLLEISIKDSAAQVSWDPLPVLSADRFQMEQLFQNLISNAIKYRSRHPLKIHMTAQKKDGEWLFSVQDNGIGFDRKYKDQIFVIFKRLHTNQQYPGTGIGLALCKKIVERHGGKIWVESTPGEGSVFYFTLPQGE